MKFEQDILDIENEIHSLESSYGTNNYRISSLHKKRDKLIKKHYSKLSPWQKVQVARHPDRPKFGDYIHTIFENFIEIRGDRLFGQDKSIVTGFATIGNTKVAVIGQSKGKTMEERISNNFGMPRPEGYRKAQRLMKLADKFNLPIISLIDTPGAFPGIESEERGQAEAIARSMELAFDVDVPIIAVVIGEGGSGGAIAIGVADYVLMLENSIYSVISPEGCASILWKNGKYVEDAANTQKLTANNLYELGIIDCIIPEKLGGAHRYPIDTMMSTKEYIMRYLNISKTINTLSRKHNRRLKFMTMGNQYVLDINNNAKLNK